MAAATPALLLFAAASPSGKVSAQIFSGLVVSGRVCCAFTGNCQPGLVSLAGVSVRLDCTLPTGTATYGVGVTNATGGYSLIIPTAGLPGISIGPLMQCSVVIPLPAIFPLVCPQLPTTGSLVGAVHVAGTVTVPLLGLFQTATVNPYVRGP